MYIKKYILILVMHCFLLKVSLAACPSNEWILNGGICYLADKAVSRSWDDAVLYCIAINSLLVHPKTNVEKDFVYSLLRSKGIGSCWIGLDDKQREGTYVWQDTTILQPSEADWMNDLGHSKYSEDCVELWPEGWNDAQCTWAKNVICQVKEDTHESIDTPTTLPDTSITSSDTRTISADTSSTSQCTPTTGQMYNITMFQDMAPNGQRFCRKDKSCIGDSLILSTNAKSTICCGWKCLYRPECYTFFYNTTNRICQLLRKSDSTTVHLLCELYFIEC